MSQSVNVRHHNAEAGATPVMVIAANAERRYLCIQNKSNAEAVVKVKVDGVDFLQAQNATQVVSFSAIPDAGGFKLVLDEQQTAEIAYDDDADAIEAALEALSNVGAGNVDVTGSYAAGFTVEFKGALANSPVNTLTVTANTLAQVAEQVGSVQEISFSAKPEAGTYRLLLGEAETANLAWNASTATIATAIDNLGGPQVDSVVRDTPTGKLTITFLPEYEVPTLVVTENLLTNNDAQASSVQKVYAAPAPASGSVKLMFGAETTVAIPFDATADQVRDAIRDLASVDEGNVAVTGTGFVSGFTVTFQGSLASAPQPALIQTQNTLASAAGNEVRVDVVQDTAGGDLTSCVASVARTVERDGGEVAVEVEATKVGRTQPDEGFELLAGESKVFEHSAVPIQAVYAVANVANTPIEIIEG
jgi:hypothetical protein